jgi:hypothetical protein
MTPVEFSQLLLLYTWFALTALLGFVLLIARFYQRSFHERTGYRWFLLPAVLFGVGSVRYASLDQLVGDPLADTVIGIGGVTLIVLCIIVFRRMLARSRGATRSDPTLR